MATTTERIAIGIGVQSDRTTVNAAVRDAVDLIVGPATGTDATGIFLRDSEDLDMDFERLEGDGGTFSGGTELASRVSGSFQRVDPSLSFTIDVRGNGELTGTPDSGDFDQKEYLKRILEMAAFDGGTPSASDTVYALVSTQIFDTIKVWRDVESWTFVGCRANLSWAFTSGVKGLLTVTVVADTVLYEPADTFPPASPLLAYGTQIDAAPVLQLALAALAGDTRGFQTATLEVTYDDEDFLDSNLIDGVVTDAGRRNVTFTGDYIVDDNQTSDDFDKLSEEFDTGTAPILEMVFNCGQAAGAATIQNAFRFDMPNLRVTTHSKVDSSKVVRTLAGYGVIAGSSGTGSADQQELTIAGI